MVNSKALAALDHAHVWHPFTPMRQWRAQVPMVIERGEGVYLFDTEGNRYLDGISSLWCNIHGHRVPEIDDAVRAQLDLVAHSTLLGLASPPSIELAARLAAMAPGGLNKIFYSDAGATALEVAFKMAVGYWFHNGQPRKNRFIALAGGYHGDTTGSMSVGYSDLFHRPFAAMVFDTSYFPAADACRPPAALEALAAEVVYETYWPSEDLQLSEALMEMSMSALEALLAQQADETAAIVLEPVMQGAAGMISQPPGFVRRVQALARKYDVLLIADEVAVGFGRTGQMFACQHEEVEPDILCLAKGLTGGYLPLAATLATDAIEQAFCGELAERRTLYHGHTYTGNALACAAALASLDLFASRRLLDHIRASERLIHDKLDTLRACPHVLDIRQRGVMVGIELCGDRRQRQAGGYDRHTGAEICHRMRREGIILRPLGDVIILMPIPAMPHDVLAHLLDVLVTQISEWQMAA